MRIQRRSWQKNGDYETAVRNYELAQDYQDAQIRVASSNQALHYSAAVSFAAEEDYENAISEFEKAEDYSDAEEQVLQYNYLLAEREYQNGEFAEAFEHYKASGFANDARGKLVDLMGELIKKGEYEQASSIVQDIGDGKELQYLAYIRDMQNAVHLESDTVHTESFEVELKKEGEANPIRVLSCLAMYTSYSDAYPTIRIKVVNNGGSVLYISPIYRIAEEGTFEQKQWRLPPYLGGYTTVKLSIDIPIGVTLNIQDLCCAKITPYREEKTEYLFQANQGFGSYAPSSTKRAFELAGEMGYQSCAASPKFTSDGICICFYDDDTIRDRLRYKDGSEIEEGSENDRPVSGFTYEELLQFDAGRKKSSQYRGMTISTLEEFFQQCVKYGMTPVLSIHPVSEFSGDVGYDRLMQIRELADAYGLLYQLRIKSGDPEVQQQALRAFGHSIAGYIMSQDVEAVWDPLTNAKLCGFIDSSARSVEESGYSVSVEFFYTDISDAKIQNALNEGFRVSVAADTTISGMELERLYSIGVTEFTVTHHCSMGLNW